MARKSANVHGQIRNAFREQQRHDTQKLHERYSNGDSSLRRTWTGRIALRRTGGIHIDSAEGIRFAFAATTLPGSDTNKIVPATQEHSAEQRQLNVDAMPAEYGSSTMDNNELQNPDEL